MIDWLLSSLAHRLYGAVDLGVLTLLEAPADEYPPYAERHFALPMRALTLVVQLAVAEHSGDAAPTEKLNGLATWTERFVGGLADLGPFRSLARADVRQRAYDFREAWLQLHDCITELAADIGVDVTFLRRLAPARAQASRDRLHHLPDDLEAELANGGGGGPDHVS